MDGCHGSAPSNCRAWQKRGKREYLQCDVKAAAFQNLFPQRRRCPPGGEVFLCPFSKHLPGLGELCWWLLPHFPQPCPLRCRRASSPKGTVVAGGSWGTRWCLGAPGGHGQPRERWGWGVPGSNGDVENGRPQALPGLVHPKGGLTPRGQGCVRPQHPADPPARSQGSFSPPYPRLLLPGDDLSHTGSWFGCKGGG